MEIVQRTESFKTLEGEFQFAYVSYFVRQNGALYYGKWRHRFSTPTTLEDLDDLEEVKTEDRGPVMEPEWSIYSGPLANVHVRTPSLLAYVNGVDLERPIRYEVEACEILKKNPHPNIAAYHGCLVTHDRVSGLCFKKYSATLMERVNPGHLNKLMFRSSGQGWSMSRSKQAWMVFWRGFGIFTRSVSCIMISTLRISCSTRMTRL